MNFEAIDRSDRLGHGCQGAEVGRSDPSRIKPRKILENFQLWTQRDNITNAYKGGATLCTEMTVHTMERRRDPADHPLRLFDMAKQQNR
jgi:hypothetical protein